MWVQVGLCICNVTYVSYKIYGMLLSFWTPIFLFGLYVQVHLKTDPLVGELFNKQLFMIVIRLKYMYFFYC